MIKGAKVLALIPARSGSKGLPGKNIKNLIDAPLINWTINAALSSEYVDKVVVSTDSTEIAAIAAEAGAEVPFLRPSDLATDISSSVNVACHAISELMKGGEEYDYLVFLEPTSPLRSKSDIDSMLEKLLVQTESRAIVSVGRTDKHPSTLYKKTGSKLSPIGKKSTSTRRQDMEEIYYPYGGMYFISVECMLEQQTFYPALLTWYEVQRWQMYEIDYPEDFIAVEAIARARKMTSEIK